MQIPFAPLKSLDSALPPAPSRVKLSEQMRFASFNVASRTSHDGENEDDDWEMIPADATPQSCNLNATRECSVSAVGDPAFNGDSGGRPLNVSVETAAPSTATPDTKTQVVYNTSTVTNVRSSKKRALSDPPTETESQSSQTTQRMYLAVSFPATSLGPILKRSRNYAVFGTLVLNFTTTNRTPAVLANIRREEEDETQGECAVCFIAGESPSKLRKVRLVKSAADSLCSRIYP